MSEELFEKEATKWAVISIHQKQSKQQIADKRPKEISHHELIYNGQVHLKRKGEGGLATLREMSVFMNRRGMEPQPKISCVADVGLPALTRKTKASTEPESAPL